MRVRKGRVVLVAFACAACLLLVRLQSTALSHPEADQLQPLLPRAQQGADTEVKENAERSAVSSCVRRVI